LNSKDTIVPISISTGKTLAPGIYKILVGAGNDEITVSKYITINVQS